MARAETFGMSGWWAVLAQVVAAVGAVADVWGAVAAGDDVGCVGEEREGEGDGGESVEVEMHFGEFGFSRPLRW